MQGRLTLRLIGRVFHTNKKAAVEKTSSLATAKNKGYLAKKVIEANLSKERLLQPSTEPAKLTVVLEMDEVLSFTFTPDEEGYLTAPRRKHDFHLWF
jgi:hypothetical protein